MTGPEDVCAVVSWCGLPAGHDGVYPGGLEHLVTAAGVYDIRDEVYHRDPFQGGSLSSTGAREITKAPAKFLEYIRNGRPDRKTLDRGRAAHRVVLGAGGDYVVVPPEVCAKDGGWSTNAAKERVAEIRAEGKTPIKPDELRVILEMAAAIDAHPTASALLRAPGRREVAVFWHDPLTGVACRTKLDTLPEPNADGLVIAVDYKSTTDASDESCAWSMWDYGYHRQAAWILDAVDSLGIVEPNAVRVGFVSQETAPPYLCNVWWPDAVALRLGAWRNTQARVAYAECTGAGVWPGYADEPHAISLPGWAERAELEAEEVGG